ncbi:MAG: PHP domain-containing protein [Kiritimatiellaeota bacterium]|nr:PHP domain-containing protein [Kiritimatiellota bacterium]
MRKFERGASAIRRHHFLKGAALSAAALIVSCQPLSAQDAAPPKAADAHLFAVSYGEALRPPKTSPRKITIPDAGDFKVLKGDFHIHTLFSDGLVMPKDRVNEAIDNGLDVIAITDHIEYRPNIGKDALKLAQSNDNHNASYTLAKAEADKKKLILVRGTEITKSVMPPGHFNALFITDANPIAAVVDDWKKMLEVATEQGGFVQWNHPGWVAPKSGGLSNGVPMSFTAAHEEALAKGHIHGIEVFNGTLLFPIVLDWCNTRDLAPTANSDIHASEWNAYGHQNPLRPMTLILASERTHDAVREAFFAKRTIGWAAGQIFGRQPWVEKLFRACVEIKAADTGLALRNLSDIPCVIEAGGKTAELPPQGTLTIPPAKKLTVANWFTATNQPLAIDL